MLVNDILAKSRYLLIFTIILFTACAPAIRAAPAVTSIPETVTPANTAIPSPQPTASPAGPVPWLLVAVGDSIAYNSPHDCPSCTGYLDRYADAITKSTGQPVEVQNLTQHNGLQIDRLLIELKNDTAQRDALANADIIIVNIAHNDVAWGRNDDPCDGLTGENPDWSKFNATCATEAAEIFRPKFESLYAQIVAMRAGKPTIFLTINRYNDWIGSEAPPEATQASHDVVDAWSAMVCKAAALNGFKCADIYHTFNGPDGLTPSGYLLARDYTHPSDKGHEVIAQVLTDLGYAPLVP